MAHKYLKKTCAFFKINMIQKKSRQLKAGGIVVKKDNNILSILLIYRIKQNDWSFPKGRVEEGETIKGTIIREIKEETGLDVDFYKELMPNRYINTRNGEDTVTYMYLLKPISFALKQENNGDKLEWIELNKVRDKLSYNNLKEYFDKIKSDIEVLF